MRAERRQVAPAHEHLVAVQVHEPAGGLVALAVVERRHRRGVGGCTGALEEDGYPPPSMGVSTWTTFFALLALIANVATIALAALWLLGR